jgi:hypothetical protein
MRDLVQLIWLIGSGITWIHCQFWLIENWGFLLWLFFGSWLSVIIAGVWPVYWLLIL